MMGQVKDISKKEVAQVIETGDLLTLKHALSSEVIKQDELISTDVGKEPILNFAIRAGQAKIAFHLLDEGADFQQRGVTKVDQKPIFLAMKTGQKEIFADLMKRCEKIGNGILSETKFIKEAMDLGDTYYAKAIVKAGGSVSTQTITDHVDKIMTDFSGAEARELVDAISSSYHNSTMQKIGTMVDAAFQSGNKEFATGFLGTDEVSQSYMIELLRQRDHDPEKLEFVVDAMMSGENRSGDLYVDILKMCLDSERNSSAVTLPMECIPAETLRDLEIDGLPVLIYAVQKKQEYFVRNLRDKCAVRVVQDQEGKTPLMHAVMADNENMITLLMRECCMDTAEHLHVKDNDGLTVADHAQRSNHYRVRHAFRGNKLVDQWVVSDDCEISFVKRKEDLGVIMTEIFNFSAQERTTLVKATGSEQIDTMQRDAFDKIPNKKMLMTAFNKYQLIKKDAPEDIVELMQQYAGDTKGTRLSLPSKKR